MRWLLVKDFQILRRSPLLVALLIIYPVALALMIGFADPDSTFGLLVSVDMIIIAALGGAAGDVGDLVPVG